MIKILDIALKDMRIASRRLMTFLFMFGLPLLITGMFYLMFGNIASQGEFNLPKTQVAIANLDHNAPALQSSRKDIPGGIRADTLSDLVVKVLQSEDVARLFNVTLYPDAHSARAAVDSQQAGVAVVIPDGFSRQYADPYDTSTIEFYADPTLTLGPDIVKSVLHQFMDGISGAKIAVKIALDQLQETNPALISEIVQQYLQSTASGSGDLRDELIQVIPPGQKPQAGNVLVSIVGPIMGGMMVFYAFYTGAARGQSILREEEDHTLQRLFTTPTPQATILAGKFLAVFLTVLVQVVVLLFAARLIFGIAWGPPVSVALIAAGAVVSASSFGIFVNSMMKDTRQSGVLFGGVLTISGMLGMISIFALNSPNAARLGNTVALLVPQGWAVRGLLQSMSGAPLSEVLPTALAMLAWGAVMFTIGVLRFNRRYV